MRNSDVDTVAFRKIFVPQATLGLLFLPLLIATGTVHAQDAGQQKALAKAQFMLRQVNAEKATLQQQVTDLQKQVDTLTKQLATATTTASARQDSLAKQMSSSESKWRGANDKLTGDLASTQEKLQVSIQQSTQLQQQLQVQTENFKLCHANNHKLYDINRELLAKYQDKGAMDALLQREPFTGVSSVEVENLIQDTQYRLDDLKLPQVGEYDAASVQTHENNSMSGGGAANTP